MMITEKYGPKTIDDALGLLVGDFIARGEFRDVYQCFMSPHLVVKFEVGENRFCNPMEWVMWREFEGTRWAKWLAPCHHISACGIVLIQAKARPIEAAEMPTRVPSFMADLKRENWGMIDGHPVCIDYGNHALYDLKRKSITMQAAKWRD